MPSRPRQARIEGSPFVVTGPAPADDIVGRADVLALLADRAARGRFVLLTAPRRFGKTSLVARLRRDAEETGDLAVVIVDLLGVQTYQDIAVRMAQAWARLPSGALARSAAKVLPFISGLTVAGGMVTVTARPPTAATATTLEGVLDVPRAVAARLDRRVLVVLDEFQAIAAVEGADAVIRSQIQHQTPAVSYLFCGSDQSVTEMLFTDRSRPLYGQAERVRLGGFEADALADHVTTRFRATGRDLADAALQLYLSAVDGHPQRSMLVADELWHIVPAGRVADETDVAAAVDGAVARCLDEFVATFGLLTEAQARVARLIAWDEPLTGAAAKRLRLSQGSARAAAGTLTEAGILVTRTDDGRRTYRHVDPLLAEWLRRLDPRP